MRSILWLTLLALFAWANPANAWWQTDWAYRKQVTIDTSPTGVNVSGPIGRTLVLVRLHSGNFTFTDAQKNGGDVRFVDSDDKTPLPFHIERFDPQTGIAFVWLSVPTLSGGEKKQVWLYFGNEKAPAGEDVGGSFDPDYTLAYHFDGKDGQPTSDKTANGNNAQTGPVQVNDGAVIARGARFPGQGQIIVPPTPSLAMPAGAPFSFTAWVKPDQLGADEALFARGPLIIGLAAGAPYVAIGDARTQAAGALKLGDWSHVAVVADGQAIRIYVNGVEAGAAAAALPAIDGPISIGGADGRPFTGEMDEVRLSKTALPAAMLLAMANSEGPQGKLVSVSETAEKQGGGGGVVVYILKETPFLDWIIIAICLVMLGIAIAVMWSKSGYIGVSRKANAAFMKRFRQMHEDLVPVRALPGVEERELKLIEKAPLYRIYDVGIDELEVRRRALGRRPLSGEAVEAMRAAVDAVVVEENQKLDKLMVLLTIAISGGPFIGLLGTVMGVMKTFGGVAMAGDVNVNAIAPGIAAALLATIAGLACAIPSLFGYNYLNSQISTLSDEMRVFVDRLITRLAEMQADAAYNNDNPPPQRIAAE